MLKIFNVLLITFMLSQGNAQVYIEKSAGVHMGSGSVISIGDDLIAVDSITGDGQIVLQGRPTGVPQLQAVSIPNLTIQTRVPVILQSNLFIDHQLLLSAGGIRLGGYDLTLAKKATVIGSNDAYLVTGGSGAVHVHLDNNVYPRDIPLGTMHHYMPLSLTYNGASYNGYVTLQAIEGTHRHLPVDATSYLNCYWRVVKSNIDGPLAVHTNLQTAGVVQGTMQDIRSYIWDGTTWKQQRAISSSPNLLSAIFNSNQGELYGMNETLLTRVRLLTNPVMHSTVLELTSAQDEEYMITIVDATGRKVRQTSLKSTKGINYKQLMFDGVASGIYSIEVRSRSFRQSLKVVKQ